MRISTSDWKSYIEKLRSCSDTAADLMQKYVQTYGFSDRDALIEYAYALCTKYGEASAELSCQMYEAVAELEGITIESAIPAETATYYEVAMGVNGSLKKSPSGQLLDSVIARLVKQPSADTVLQNAKRDGAMFAWIPFGDTCSFCLTLASRGWQYVDNKNRKPRAEHIHQKCDCQYAVSFTGGAEYEGYDPGKYEDMYYSAYGRKPSDKINAMRRMSYADNKDKINAQQREAYRRRKEFKESGRV